MGLQRSNTRFGLSSLRDVTPDDKSNDTRPLLAGPEYDYANKLRKRKLASPQSSQPSSRESSQDYEIPPKVPRVSQEGDREDSRIDSKSPQILQTYQPKPWGTLQPKVKYSSPWDVYRKRISLMLNDSVTIACRKRIFNQEDALIVAIRQFSGPEANQKAAMLQRIRNKNFLACLECFSFEGSLYVILEHELDIKEKLPITLRQYALIDTFPTEEELVLIIGPILDGLEYLASEGLEHGALTCKNVLIGLKGSIKIAGQECCRAFVSSRNSPQDIKGVGRVVMELINKDDKIDGPVKIHDTRRWPLESNVVTFLFLTQSAYSIDKLKEHPLFSRNGRQIGLEYDEELYREIVFKWNVYTAEILAFRGYQTIKSEEEQ